MNLKRSKVLAICVTIIRFLCRHVGQQIDVGTVDGYQVCKRNTSHTCTLEVLFIIQGKEKDVTILSCVRAKNTSGSIG